MKYTLNTEYCVNVVMLRYFTKVGIMVFLFAQFVIKYSSNIKAPYNFRARDDVNL